MIASLAFLKSVPRWAWYAIGAVALVISVLVYLNRRDARVIEQDRAERTAKVTKTVLEAERTANRNDAERRVVIEVQTRELERAREQAIEESPDEANRPAGPAVSAVLDSLREQGRGDSRPAP